MIALVLFFPATVHAQPDAELKKTVKDIEVAGHWIYDDLPKAIAEGKATGKPLFIVLRCVPCPPGRTLDAQVAQPDKELEKLEQKFVCVRIIQTNGLDLKLFQYDYDQSWTAMFMNADMTIYGRYGTRAGRGPESDRYLTLPSLKKAMERALEVHRNYPANKESLAAKVGKQPEYAAPEKVPGLEKHTSRATSRQSCIHCHMVRDYALRARWEQKKLTAADLFTYPMPDNIGMSMDPEDGLIVKAVTPGSLAARAGLAVGDAIISFNRQPLLSLADIQWVLHNADSEAKLPITVRRQGATLDKTLTLSGNWRESDLGWRASSWYGLRRGLKVDPLPGPDRDKLGLSGDKMALKVIGMFDKGPHILQKNGLSVGDIILSVDGKSSFLTESQFLVYLRLNHTPAETVTFTIQRGKKQLDLKLPMW